VLSIHEGSLALQFGIRPGSRLVEYFPEGMALFRALAAYTEIAGANDCSLVAAFTFMIA
jgi:hypothetical protein